MRHHALLQHRRAELEARIQEMIELLDVIDGDPDLEDGADDEPSLGGTARMCGTEIVDDIEQDFADMEPWLGRSERIDQTLPEGQVWDPDREMDDDSEPSLGWANPLGLRIHVPEEAAQLQSGGDNE